MKEKILAFLQEKGYDLRKILPNLMDAKFEDNPPRLLLVFLNKIPEMPELVKKLEFTVESVLGEDNSKNVVNGDKNLENWQKRHNLNKGEVPDDIKEAINPGSRNANRISALEAWRKRHRAVKIK